VSQEPEWSKARRDPVVEAGQRCRRVLPQGIFFDQTQGVQGYNDITPRFARCTICSATARRPSVQRRPVPRGGVNDNGAYSRLAPSNVSRRAPTGRGTIPTATSTRIAICRTRSQRRMRPDRFSSRASGRPSSSNNYDPAVLKGWASVPATGQIGAPANSSSRRASRWKSRMSAGGCRTSTSRTTCRSGRPTSRNSASSLRGFAAAERRQLHHRGASNDINPSAFGLTNNIVTAGSNYGTLKSVTTPRAERQREDSRWA